MKPGFQWLYAEKAVAMIEKAISPDAHIEHNKRLKVIGSHRRRQCDVIIRLGKEPRRQFLLVEVQKRGAKPDINTFDGWVAKMEEVGANGLICVSEVGWPASVVEKVATRLGPRVQLMTLSANSDEPVWSALNLAFRVTVIGIQIKFDDIEQPRFENGPVTLSSISPETCIVSITGKTPDIVKLSQYLRWQVANHDTALETPVAADGFSHQNLDISNSASLWVHVKDHAMRVASWRIAFGFKRAETELSIPFTQMSYTPQGEGSSIAWLATAEMDMKGAVMKFSLTLVPDKNGYLRVNQSLDAPSDRVLQPMKNRLKTPFPTQWIKRTGAA